MLLSLYKEKRDSFRSKSHIRHSTLYNEMAVFMEPRTAQQCRNKLSDLLDQFRKAFDKEGKSGRSPTKFEWYSTILAIEEGSSNLHAPYAYSVGAEERYSKEGVNAPQSTRSFRARGPRSNAQQEEARGVVVREGGGSARVRRPLTWAQDVQQQQIESRNALVGEVRKWREQQHERNCEKNLSLSVIAESMRVLAEAALAKTRTPNLD